MPYNKKNNLSKSKTVQQNKMTYKNDKKKSLVHFACFKKNFFKREEICLEYILLYTIIK